MQEKLRIGRRLVGLALAVAQLFTPLAGSLGVRTAQAEPATVEMARGQYERAQYDDAIKTLDGPLQSGALKGEDLWAAEALTARCYVKKGMPELGREHFRRIMKAECSWTLDAREVPEDEFAVYADVVKELPRCPKGASNEMSPAHHSRMWWYIGGAAVVVAVVVAILSKKTTTHDSNPKSLPGYPDPPTL